MNQQFVWEKSPLQERVDTIPTATKFGIACTELDQLGNTGEPTDVNTKGYIGVAVQNELVGVVSTRYALVQHKEAFNPIVKGLDAFNIDYQWNVFVNKGKAWLSVLIDDMEAADTVKVGFRAMNSVDGTTAIKYSFVMGKAHRYVELVGYRQVCSNGMKIRVPIDNAEFVKLEVREKVIKLLEEHTKIIHTGDKTKEIQAVQYVVEAVALLKDSVSKIIDKAESTEIGKQEAADLIRKYIGKRMSQRIHDRFAYEHPTLWGLYNATTYVASHGEVKQSTSNGLIEKAADMLEQEISVEGA